MSDLEKVLDRYRYHPQFLGGPINSVNDAGAMGDRPLHIACYAKTNPDSLKHVTELLELGADPNVQGDRGFTPLQIAISCSTIEVVSLLVNAGARIDIKDDDGETAEDAAQFAGKEIRDIILRGKRSG